MFEVLNFLVFQHFTYMSCMLLIAKSHVNIKFHPLMSIGEGVDVIDEVTTLILS